MKFIKYIMITLSIFLILSLTSCSTEYDDNIKEYNKLFDGTINLIEPENVSKSIISNNLELNLEQLESLINEIEKSTRDFDDELLLIRTKHALLKEIIEKGTRWDTLSTMEKYSINNSIDSLKK